MRILLTAVILFLASSMIIPGCGDEKIIPRLLSAQEVRAMKHPSTHTTMLVIFVRRVN